MKAYILQSETGEHIAVIKDGEIKDMIESIKQALIDHYQLEEGEFSVIVDNSFKEMCSYSCFSYNEILLIPYSMVYRTVREKIGVMKTTIY